MEGSTEARKIWALQNQGADNYHTFGFSPYTLFCKDKTDMYPLIKTQSNVNLFNSLFTIRKKTEFLSPHNGKM